MEKGPNRIVVTMRIDIANISIELISDVPEMDPDFLRQDTGTISGSSETDFILHLVSKIPADSSLFNLEARGSGHYASVGKQELLVSPSTHSLIDWDKRIMYFSLLNDNDGIRYPWIWELRLLVSLLIIEKNGIPVHGSAVSDIDGNGFVCIGPSGAGKSTIANMLCSSTSRYILNDEFSLIRPIDGKYTIFANPFNRGSTAERQRSPQARLEKIFVLQKGNDNYTEPMLFREKYSALLSNCYTIIASRWLCSRLMHIVEEIVTTIPMKRLCFSKDGTIADRINEL